jgi:hypothetical protein
MSLNSLKMPHITGKASHHLKKSLSFSENTFKKNLSLYKSLNFAENIFKISQILKNKKASHSQQKKTRGTCRIAITAIPRLTRSMIPFIHQSTVHFLKKNYNQSR